MSKKLECSLGAAPLASAIANDGAKVLDKIQRVKFTEPHRDSPVGLEHYVQQRRSVRGFRAQALTEGQLSQLLWAAQGVTGADAKRAVPSAGALYPLELYVAIGNITPLSTDVYHYLPSSHELLLVAPGHQRERLVEAAGGQDWIATAPAIICIVAAFERTSAKYGNLGRGYVYLEAGHAAESLMLQAVGLGLATTMVGAFNDDEMARFMHLGGDETPVCLIPVGTP